MSDVIHALRKRYGLLDSDTSTSSPSSSHLRTYNRDNMISQQYFLSFNSNSIGPISEIARPKQVQSVPRHHNYVLPSKSFYTHKKPELKGEVPIYMQHAFLNEDLVTSKNIFDRDGFLHKTLVVDNQLELSELSKNDYFEKINVQELGEHEEMLERQRNLYPVARDCDDVNRHVVKSMSRSSSPTLRFAEAIAVESKTSVFQSQSASIGVDCQTIPEPLIKPATMTSSKETQTITSNPYETRSTSPMLMKLTNIDRETQTTFDLNDHEYIPQSSAPPISTQVILIN